MKPRRLRFFVELDAADLASLFTDEVLAMLRGLEAGVTLALRDLSAERARVVRKLQVAGVPIGAWLLVERQHGYFATLHNVDAVAAQAERTLAWARTEGLAFEALGLDFEPDLRELDALFERPVSTMRQWLMRARTPELHADAEARYRTLVAALRAEGVAVESYQLPTLVEDRRKGRAALARLTGSVDVPTDREVVMLYSSLLGPTGAGLVAHWAPHCRAVGLGSTGGGVDPLPKLDWVALERDLLVAAAHVDDISVFSLEGCVAQGFLPRLRDFEWNRPAPTLALQKPMARGLRAAVRTVGRLAMAGSAPPLASKAAPGGSSR